MGGACHEISILQFHPPPNPIPSREGEHIPKSFAITSVYYLFPLFVQSFQGGYEGSAEMLDAAEGEGFQGVADDVFFQVKGAVVFRAVDKVQVDGEAPITASMIQIHLTPLPRHFILAIAGLGKNRGDSLFSIFGK